MIAQFGTLKHKLFDTFCQRSRAQRFQTSSAFTADMAHVHAHSAGGTYVGSYTTSFSVHRLPSCCGAPAASKRHRSLALQHQAVGHHDLSGSRVCCSLRRDCTTAAVASAAPAAQAGAAASSSSDGSQSASYAAVQQLVQDRGLDADPALVAQEAHLTFNYLQSQVSLYSSHKGTRL
jgi:hypothetical protein